VENPDLKRRLAANEEPGNKTGKQNCQYLLMRPGPATRSVFAIAMLYHVLAYLSVDLSISSAAAAAGIKPLPCSGYKD
jgi:hypothetical protein